MEKYAIDPKWFNEINCRRPSYETIGFDEIYFLNEQGDILDYIELLDSEKQGKEDDFIYLVNKEKYDKVKKYLTKSLTKNITKEEALSLCRSLIDINILATNSPCIISFKGDSRLGQDIITCNIDRDLALALKVLLEK